MTTKIEVDELPFYSPWVRDLLEDYTVEYFHRTQEHVQREYDEKYGRLKWARSMEDARKIELRQDVRRPVAMSRGDDLFAASVEEAMDAGVKELLAAVLKLKPMSVVDLGCGYGYFLWRLRQASTAKLVVAGGETNGTARAIAQRLLPERVEWFTFEHNYEILRNCVPEPVVVTSYALHQLPTAAPVLDALSYWRDKITEVVCFEPEEDYFGGGLLGRLRRLYGRANDYSADLIRCLDRRDDVEILDIHPNVVGANALLPGTITVWRFK